MTAPAHSTASTWTSPDVSECEKCGMPMVWATSTSTGGRIPVAFKTSPDGTLALRRGAAGPVATSVRATLRFGRTDLRLPHQAECRPRRPGSGTAHAYELDESIPGDFNGRRWCLACGLPGEEGDRRHPRGALPAPRPATPGEGGR